MSPTQRTLKWLRDAGYLAEVVEKWNPFSKKKKDLFGIIDIIAVGPMMPTIGVQCTSASNFSARMKKIRASENGKKLLAYGWDIWVVGWKKGSKEPRIYSFGGDV